MLADDDMDPLDDNELIQDQSYIPSLEEADKYGRTAPGHGEGKGVHAAGLSSAERQRMENAHNRQARSRAAKAKSSPSGINP
eukprot:516740-Prorocentrum_lima.AAC.1